ncbi:component of SufBCD complex [Lentibacter algarum]|uniref:component of SufBCD complex n=1 Tax=Lentibacter algarum TaxID=576131 RepID=UPI001C09B71B|nr:component of SufBCD complex [Lentibacter algarum]MBU2982388.1 component of SufBCD complex [Lentibacter algarum]
MDWYTTVFELIDMRSFSNLWFWIALAVMWSTTSHWVLGVPWDMVLRAQRDGEQFEHDLVAITRINTNRLLHIANVSGLWVLGFSCFFLTMLLLLGFVYQYEFAQALFLLAFPMAIIGMFSISTARLIDEEQATGARLAKLLMRQRLITQVIGMVSIFVTALWGMYQNLSYGPLG